MDHVRFHSCRPYVRRASTDALMNELVDSIFCACAAGTRPSARSSIRGEAQISFLIEWNKWKNHFYKMKGDVGMSGHEKERKQEDAYTKIQTHS